MLALALCAQRALAFVDPPYITPANPTAGETISVNVYRGECDVLNIGIVPPVIEQHESAITALFTGIHAEDPEWCLYSIGTETVPVGSYPAGSYTLDVERRYGNALGSWTQETLGIIPFTVSGMPSQQTFEAPTLRHVGLGALLLGLITIAMLTLRTRRV
ncbi:MAG TPA: hypothetical protein VKB52_05615 [Rhodanobacteraceae bacterium]|nr:hypothetical protein [Rhodanobacteraceae bacterium]